MKTDQFVELLLGDAAPPRTLQSALILAGTGGAAIAAALFLLPSDSVRTSRKPLAIFRFLFKFVITLALAATACIAAARFERPDGQMTQKAFPALDVQNAARPSMSGYRLVMLPAKVTQTRDVA